MASEATKEDAQLLLELYDLRREKVLRRARDFVQNGCTFKNYGDFQKQYRNGSRKYNYVGMVLGYWDMACTLVAQGLINEELFNSTNFEHVGLWFKFRPLVEAWRKESKRPDLMRNLETIAVRHPAAAAFLPRARGKAPGKARAPRARKEQPAEGSVPNEEAASVA